jgi:hypothetical protein
MFGDELTMLDKLIGKIVEQNPTFA